MPNNASAIPKPRRGRPSKNDTHGADQKAIILNAAIDLFSTQGFQATTMSQIAKATRYNQSSLYYWFKRKEDILESIVQNSEKSLRVATEISENPNDKTAQLYAIMYADIVMMCSSVFDFFELEDIAHTQDGYLDRFFETYRRLTDALEKIVEDGIESGEFKKTNAAKLTITALALNEGLQHRYHMKQKYTGESTRMLSKGTDEFFSSMESLAHVGASITVNAVVKDPCDIDQVRERARGHGWIE